MSKVVLLRKDTVDPKKLMRLLAPMVLSDDPDAMDMARRGEFDDPVFDQLQSGVLHEDLDYLASSLCLYLPDDGYANVRQRMLDKIAVASQAYLTRDGGQYFDIEDLVNKFIGDARLDRWVGYILIRSELEQLEPTMTKADKRRVQSWLRAARDTAETGMTTTPSVTFTTADRRRADEDPDGQSIALGLYAYRMATWSMMAATQNATAMISNRMVSEVDDPDWDSRPYSDRFSIVMESIAPTVADAIRVFPERR